MEGKRGKKTEEWKEIITRAYREGPTVKGWCREHQIPYSAFSQRRRKFIRERALERVFGQVRLPAAKTESLARGLLLLPSWETANPTEVYLVVEPIQGSLSVESLAAILWFGFGMDYRQGQIFVFISRRKQSLYALRFRDGGFDRLERKREQGTFRWPSAPGPEGSSSLRRCELEALLSVLTLGKFERKEVANIQENH